MKKNTISCILPAMLAAMLVLASCELGDAEAPPSNLVRPYISVQPESGSFYTNSYEPYDLKVEVWDWRSDDGSLSYQWYQFDDIDDYCKNGGAAIEGATGKTYSPDLTPVAGKKHYFYVVVTNTKSDALDETSGEIQSEVATIAFSAPGDPLVPIISRNPANASYGWGRALNALKVEARMAKIETSSGDIVSAPGTMTYQWYSNDEFKIQGGTALLENADTASFIPGYDILQIDKNYFYVQVTNTINKNLPTEKTAVAVSVPAVITMEPGLRAASPRITRQPVDRLFFTAAEITEATALEVDAESPDRGALSYQWYSNAKELSKEGTLISGATGKKYIPPAANSFYYVVVTNTNNNVSGAKTAALTSKAVRVRTAASGTLTANAVVTIPDPLAPANQAQYVRGYGGMDVAWDNFPRLEAQDTELMYDPEQMGYNILRIMIRPDNIDIRKTMDDMTSGLYRDYYENVKIVNKYGGYVAASPWTPPKEWKSNNSINGGGNLIPAYYRLFANYLRTFAQLMYDKGAPIYCISISNEPNYVAGYDGCEWSPEEMMNFWLEVGRFTNGIRGYGGGKEIPYVLTMNGESANTPYINRTALGNQQSRAVIDLLARHIYGKRKESLWNDFPADIQKGLPTDLNKGRMEVWMTEHNINSANATGYYNDSTWNYVWRYLNDVDLVMRINNENAFVWWASKRFYSMVGDGQFGTTDHKPLPRGWALTHYARYTTDTTRILLKDGSITGTFADNTTLIGGIERGDSRVNNTDDNMDNLSARITAYVSRDGNEISLVMWTPTETNGSSGYDMGTVQIKLPAGFLIGGVKAHRSTGDLDNQIFQLADQDVTVNPDRNSAYVSLPRSNILSVKFTKK